MSLLVCGKNGYVKEGTIVDIRNITSKRYNKVTVKHTVYRAFFKLIFETMWCSFFSSYIFYISLRAFEDTMKVFLKQCIGEFYNIWKKHGLQNDKNTTKNAWIESIFTYWFKPCYSFFKILYFTIFSFNFFLQTKINFYVKSCISKITIPLL